MCCPIPGPLPHICTEIMASRPWFERHPRFVGGDGLPATGGWVESCLHEVDTGKRLAFLLRGALVDALGPEPGLALRRFGNVRLLLGLPSWSAVDSQVSERLWAALDATVLALSNPSVATFAADHTSVFMALREAQRTLDAGEAQAVVVAGVDSLCAPVILDYLLSTGRGALRGAPYAPIPGEAAGVLVVSRDGSLPGRALSRIDALHIELEEARLEDPNRGLLGGALGRCLVTVLEDLRPEQRPGLAFSDCSGERPRSEELGAAIARLNSPPECLFTPICPSESIGDVGAAFGAVAAIVSHWSLAAVGGSALICASTHSPADGGHNICAAMRLSRAG